MIKPYEFWHPRIFEAPYYIYLAIQCLLNRVSIKNLAKANYALNHGEIGIGSKYETQMAFDQSYFLPTLLIHSTWQDHEKREHILQFIKEHGYPVILKSDVGCVGKGIRKITSSDDLEEVIPLLLGDYLLQKFTPYQYECGVFYTRLKGKSSISGINRKHFPSVTGNGQDTILSLAKNHYRYTHHWHSFLQYLDGDYIPAEGEEVVLSFIGSHTLGCKFTDDLHLLTPELEQAFFSIFESQPGYNFGRVDVKAESEAAFKAGRFVVIEINGIASLPTQMFDPKYSVWDAYRIFLAHGKWLVKIAKENKQQAMSLLSYKEIINKAKNNQSLLNEVHGRLKGD